MKYSVKIIFILVFFVACRGSDPGNCEEPGHTAFVGQRTLHGVDGSGTENNVGVRMASFFRDVISPVDGDRCPSLPTCSSYSVNAFKKHGFFIGWLMTVDRLIHEGDEGNVSPRVYHKGRFRTFDSVENNDYWWYRKNKSAQK